MLNRTALTATIAAGTALSDAVDLLGYDLVAIEFPAAWTAADVTFQTSPDGVTYRNVFDDAGTPVEIVVGADVSLHVIVRDAVQRGLARFVKVRSGPSAVPVNQVAAASIVLIGRTIS